MVVCTGTAMAHQRQRRTGIVADSGKFGITDLERVVEQYRCAGCRVKRLVHTGSAEGGVEGAISIETCESEVAIAINRTHPTDKNLAVCLHTDAVANVCCTTKIHGEHPVSMKSGIEAAIHIVTRKGKVSITTSFGAAPCNKNFAITLQNSAASRIRRATKVRGELAISMKGGIKRTISVVAHNREIAVKCGECVIVREKKATGADHKDLAITLDENTLRRLIPAKICNKLAISMKGGVKAAISVVAGKRNIVIGGCEWCSRCTITISERGTGIPCHQNSAISLHCNTISSIITAKVRRKLSISIK